MLTTTSKSENSNRCGVSASRSLGPISGSASISEKILSITSRSSLADSNEALMAQEPPAAGFGAAGLASGVAAGAGAGGLGAAGGAGLTAAAGFLAAAGAAGLTAAAGFFAATGFFAAARLRV